MNILELVQSWWVQGQTVKNLWDLNVKIIFLILNEGKIVKLVCTQLIPVGDIPEVGAMCLIGKIPES